MDHLRLLCTYQSNTVTCTVLTSHHLLTAKNTCILTISLHTYTQTPVEVTETKKPVAAVQKPSAQKWKGGPGTYQVVQCGTAGHNVRSKPGMKGTPVGRLAKGNKIEVLEEVRKALHQYIQ